MKNITIIVLFVGLFFSCNNDHKKIKELEPSVFKKHIEKQNVQLVDARTLKEFNTEHLYNALLIDVKESDFLYLSKEKLIKEKPIYIYCKSGRRSKKATKILLENGFTEVYNLKGGILNWKSKEFNTVKK